MVVPCVSVVSRPGIVDHGEGVCVWCGPGMGLFMEIRAHEPLSEHSNQLALICADLGGHSIPKRRVYVT
jgi:hypothetical protein